MTAARLHQIGINYNPEQDRLVLLIKMSDMSEVRTWITRRYLKLLWPTLIQSIGQYVEPEHQADPVSKEAVMGFQHAEKVSKADFNTQFEKKVSSTPLGETPVLLAKLSLKPGPSDHQILGLFPKEGQGIELVLNDTMLHSLCKLIMDAQKAAEWGLNLTVPGADQAMPTDETKLN